MLYMSYCFLKHLIYDICLEQDWKMQFFQKCFRADVTHLSLYNLSVIHKKKYFDSEMHLMTYINDNWELLQLGEVRTLFTN